MPLARLGVYQFGEQLITTRDLDPVYVILWEAQLPLAVLQRWLVAYWSFYSCGTASWITDQTDYWGAMGAAAASKDYPRSAERRHYRGQLACRSVAWLRERGVDGLFSQLGNGSLAEVMTTVRGWYGFGDWIAFKVADMLERLALARVVFQPADVFRMFDSPRKGAADMARYYGPASGEETAWAYNKLIKRLGQHRAPPRYERRLNIQEVETCLCKWHSHLGGHYTVGKDIREIHHGLEKFSNTKTAQRLLKAGQKLWNLTKEPCDAK